MIDLNFYKGKRVLVTGHSGFKGAWLCRILKLLDSKVYGLSLMPKESPNLFSLADVLNCVVYSDFSDVRNFNCVMNAFDVFRPEIVIHLAAQPIVRESYRNPKLTYETNVVGSLNILECVRMCTSVKSVLNITTEKVYENKEAPGILIDESFPLNGYDPYSNSKSCSELVTETYRRCFFEQRDCSISTARTSNIIGGGDFAVDRIIPDCIRAAVRHEKIIVRNPQSCRPYQFILDPLFAYLEICEKQFGRKTWQGCYNITPDNSVNTGKLVELFCEKWGNGVGWESSSRKDGLREADSLIVSNKKFKDTFGWKSAYSVEDAVENVIEWTKAWMEDPCSIPVVMEKQIMDYLKRVM